MTLQELQSKIAENNIPESWYALDELKPDALVIYSNYSKFELFYLDERGGRNDMIVFSSIEQAYDELWRKLEYQLAFLKRIG